MPNAEIRMAPGIAGVIRPCGRPNRLPPSRVVEAFDLQVVAMFEPLVTNAHVQGGAR